MGEKNIWERIKDSSNCRVLILNLILTLCLNLLLEFTERRSVSEVFSFVQERTFLRMYLSLAAGVLWRLRMALC